MAKTTLTAVRAAHSTSQKSEALTGAATRRGIVAGIVAAPLAAVSARAADAAGRRTMADVIETHGWAMRRWEDAAARYDEIDLAIFPFEERVRQAEEGIRHAPNPGVRIEKDGTYDFAGAARERAEIVAARQATLVRAHRELAREAKRRGRAEASALESAARTAELEARATLILHPARDVGEERARGVYIQDALSFCLEGDDALVEVMIPRLIGAGDEVASGG